MRTTKLSEKYTLRAMKLVDRDANGTEGSPVRAGHIVHPYDPVVSFVRHVDLSGRVHKDAIWVN